MPRRTYTSPPAARRAALRASVGRVRQTQASDHSNRHLCRRHSSSHPTDASPLPSGGIALLAPSPTHPCPVAAAIVVARRPSPFAILQASCCRRSSACSRLSACFAAPSAAAGACVRSTLALRLPERGSRLDLGEPSCFAAGRCRACDEAGYTPTLPSALPRNQRLRGRSTWRRSTTVSCLSAATSAGMVPRIAVRSC